MPPPQGQPKVPAKKFKVEAWTGENDGEKIVVYGDTGKGKTTLCSMLPNAIFIGLDDGGRRIVHPQTGEPIRHVPDVMTYGDMQAAVQTVGLFPKGSTLVVDTFTLLEQVVERHVLATVMLPKGGGYAQNLKQYGWNEGSSHVLDAVRVILQDFDALKRRGVNVCLVCQEQAITIANPEGTDYLQACPKLHHDRQYSVMLEICAWADHVFRIDYLNTEVKVEGGRTVGRVASLDTTRIVEVQGARHYRAKSRTLSRFVGEDDVPIRCTTFSEPGDDTVWKFLFGDTE